jgi:hypothetical protein
VTTEDIVIKHTQPLRIAEVTAVAPGPGPDNVGPIFRRLIPQVLAVLDRNGLTPGMSVATTRTCATTAVPWYMPGLRSTTTRPSPTTTALPSLTCPSSRSPVSCITAR